MKLPAKQFILFTEDDTSAAEVLKLACSKASLKPENYKIVEHGLEAVSFLERTQPPHAKVPVPTRIVIDVKMPLMNGIQLITWIKEQPHLKKTEITIISGVITPDQTTCARKMGVKDILQKPCRFEDLVARIRKWQDRGKN